MSLFDVRTFDSSDAFGVSLDGEVDMSCEARLRSIVDQVQASDRRDVLIDLSRVTFMDSRGIAMLVEFWRLAAQRSGTATLIGPSKAVKRTLDITGVSALFEVV